jgi:hypothetical protein
MYVRKNVTSLSEQEKEAFVEGLLALKRQGRYDEYVHWHHAVMKPSVWPFEPKDANYRNAAHRGPSFLPWHREFLLQVETDLRAIDSSISIPYWDWTADAAMTDPTASPRSGTRSSWATTGWKQTVGALLPDRLLIARATGLSPRAMTGQRSAASLEFGPPLCRPRKT